MVSRQSQRICPEILLDRRTIDRGVFQKAELERYVTEHASGRWDNGYRLWTLLIAELWFRTWLDPASPPIEPQGRVTMRELSHS